LRLKKASETLPRLFDEAKKRIKDPKTLSTGSNLPFYKLSLEEARLSSETVTLYDANSDPNSPYANASDQTLAIDRQHPFSERNMISMDITSTISYNELEPCQMRAFVLDSLTADATQDYPGDEDAISSGLDGTFDTIIPSFSLIPYAIRAALPAESIVSSIDTSNAHKSASTQSLNSLCSDKNRRTSSIILLPQIYVKERISEPGFNVLVSSGALRSKQNITNQSHTVEPFQESVTSCQRFKERRRSKRSSCFLKSSKEIRRHLSGGCQLIICCKKHPNE